MFLQTGITVFTAIFQLFMIAFFAGILVRRQFISGLQIEALSAVTVNVFLPCLIIAKTLSGFHPEAFPNWWILPLSGIVIVVLGLVFSGLIFRMNPEKRPLMTLASMQNGIYIVLPIGQILFPDQFDQFALYCFLLVMGLNPMMWSIGKVMISGDIKSRIRASDFFTPPLAAIFISTAAVFTGMGDLVPGSILASLDLLGQATVPIAVFVLGATIGSISFKQLPSISDILRVSLVKFVLVPGSVFTLVYLLNFNISLPLVCTMLMIQASSPPATNLILIVKRYGGDTQTISAMMLIQYLIAIFAMPVWIAVWQNFN